MDCSLYQHITVPPRKGQGQNNNKLDLVLTIEEHVIEKPQIEPPLGMSDHVGYFKIFMLHF